MIHLLMRAGSLCLGWAFETGVERYRIEMQGIPAKMAQLGHNRRIPSEEFLFRQS